jgi:predicted phage terminase large subunit-like protein
VPPIFGQATQRPSISNSQVLLVLSGKALRHGWRSSQIKACHRPRADSWAAVEIRLQPDDLPLSSANKSTELSDFSVCTTWGRKNKKLFLLHVLRKRMDYPELKRAVREQFERFRPTNILIEDKASGTQLIQELIRDNVYGVTGYEPTMDKIMRLYSVSNTIENGFVYLPAKAEWLSVYLHELTTFPNGKHDDQADSTSQALDWAKAHHHTYRFLNIIVGKN